MLCRQACGALVNKANKKEPQNSCFEILQFAVQCQDFALLQSFNAVVGQYMNLQQVIN